MRRVAFDVPGKPFAKQRARATRQGRVYTPKETVSFEWQLGQIAMLHFAAPFAGPVRLTIFAVFQPPASWSGSKTAATLGRPHTQRPDLDNIAKAAKDALNRIAWADDAQVAELVCRKSWGTHPNTALIVEEIR
jgi:Holliday junction resolvase RusA-like endonuclease